MSIAPREVERRSVPLAVELRASGERRIGGYATKFNHRSLDLGGFVEIVEPRAFNKSASDGWAGVSARFNHKDEMLLGTVAAGTLRLSLDGTGLDYEVDVPECRADVLELTARKDIRNSSFAFQVYDQDYTHENGLTVRHLTSVRLIDVAPVVNPAYPDASVALRSLALQFDAEPDDVYALAREGELRRLFVRTGTDHKNRPLTPRTPRQALLELMRVHPCAPQPLPLTPARARAQLTRMAMPQPTKTAAQRRKELTDLAKPVYQIMRGE